METRRSCILYLVVILTFLSTLWAGDPAANANPPLHIVYWQVFREVTVLAHKGSELEKQGTPNRLNHLFKERAKLSDEQENALLKIAKGCDAEVNVVNRKARKIIEASRALHPKGQLAPGGKPPLAPPELKSLNQERNAIILTAVEQLRQEFGDDEFERFDQFVHEHIASRIGRVPKFKAPPSQPGPNKQPSGLRTPQSGTAQIQ